MPSKKFAKAVLRECLWGGRGPLIEEEDTITDTGRWSIHHLLTFKEKESGKYYQVAYSRGATESQEERPFEYDDDEMAFTPLKFTNDTDDLDRWDPLYTYITQSITALRNGERVKDFEHYVFEHALEAVYGPDVWESYNKLVDE